MKNPDFELFCSRYPEIADKFKALYQSTVTRSTLDPKTQQLLYISHLAANRYAPAVKGHIPIALQAGATKQEIMEALFVSLPISGIVPVLEVLHELLEYMDQVSD